MSGPGPSPMRVSNATERFSERVADYVRYRPDYPAALTDWLRGTLGVTPAWRVADIGAGTGISTKMLLDAGNRVMAVEPNLAMREAAIAWLGSNPRFRAVDGSAGATGLPDGSVDLVTAAQAFHWFDPQATHREFARILCPHGLVAVWWNSRRLGGTPFLDGYEALLRRYGTDYAEVAERHIDDANVSDWFGHGLRATAHFDHAQRFDFDGLRGRLMSSSYAPRPGHPDHDPMLRDLRELFDSTSERGLVGMDYDTRVYAGEMT